MSGRKLNTKSHPLTLLISHSQQKWSTYALHIATFTSLAFVFDPLYVYAAYKAGEDLPGNGLYYVVATQLTFMAWTKVIKLIGLFRRDPIDIIYLPVSIIFGYFHGLIKLWALATLRMVSYPSQTRTHY